MKKILAICLILILVLSFASCSAGEGEEGEDLLPEGDGEILHPDDTEGDPSDVTIDEGDEDGPPLPTSETTEVTVEVADDTFTLSLAGRAAEELWYGVEMMKIGEGYSAFIKTNFGAENVGLLLDLTYIDGEMIPSEDVGEYTFTRDEITFSKPVADMPTMPTRDADGVKGPDKTFDFNLIEEVVFWVMCDTSEGNTEYHEVFSVGDMTVTGDFPPSVMVTEGEGEEQNGDEGATLPGERPKSEETEIEVIVSEADGMFSLTVTGFAAEAFWIESEKALAGSGTPPTFSLDAGTPYGGLEIILGLSSSDLQPWTSGDIHNYSYDADSMTFTSPTSELPTKLVFDSANNSSEQPFDVADISGFNFYVSGYEDEDPAKWYIEAKDATITVN